METFVLLRVYRWALFSELSFATMNSAFWMKTIAQKGLLTGLLVWDTTMTIL